MLWAQAERDAHPTRLGPINSKQERLRQKLTSPNFLESSIALLQKYQKKMPDFSETGANKESPELKVLFTMVAEELREKSGPTVESFPNGSMPPDSVPSTSEHTTSKVPWIILLITLFFANGYYSVIIFSCK